MRSHHRWREEEEPRNERERGGGIERENKTDKSVLQSIITERRRVCCERYCYFTEMTDYKRHINPRSSEKVRKDQSRKTFGREHCIPEP